MQVAAAAWSPVIRFGGTDLVISPIGGVETYICVLLTTPTPVAQRGWSCRVFCCSEAQRHSGLALPAATALKWDVDRAVCCTALTFAACTREWGGVFVRSPCSAGSWPRWAPGARPRAARRRRAGQCAS